MSRTKHATMCGNEQAGSSHSFADHSGEPDYFFCNPECVEKFYNDFSKRKVMLGRKVSVESLSDFEIERLFVKQGWRNLLDMGNEVFPKYVRIFFSNMIIGWEARGLFPVRSMVGGREIILNEVILGDILGIPHVGIWAYEFKTWPVCKGFDYGEALVYLLGNGVAEDAPRKIHANQLPIRLRLLHLICTHNLIPRGGHREEVTFMDVFVIERLLKEKKFNLPYIMLKHMEAMYDDEDVDVETKDEPEGEEVDAEAMEFDVDADLADDPPIIPSPTRVPDPTSSFDLGSLL
ncbi:hypothetical protein CJ030_MR3G009424 [Morella rubra]|uniref:Uncharacterized protein n=1 Tax=Morella rubra TaxID=262757 RepID=A0A6A1W8H8_9ROSI|nr:hypothetical protein CJ030_MR3G009424 [Morella rubra]